MGVDFTSNGDGTSNCDVCGETIDDDHYADMQAHDTWHYEQREKAAALPRAVVIRVGDKYHVGRRLGTWAEARDWYTEIGSSNDRDFAKEIAHRIEDGTIS